MSRKGLPSYVAQLPTPTGRSVQQGAAAPVHAQDDGRSVGPDSVAQAAVQERQRRQEIDALEAIAHELRTLNSRVLDLTREMRDLRRELERKR